MGWGGSLPVPRRDPGSCPPIPRCPPARPGCVQCPGTQRAGHPVLLHLVTQLWARGISRTRWRKQVARPPKRCPCLQQSSRSQHSQLPKRPLHPYYTDVPHLTASNSIIRNIFSAIHLPDCLPPAPSVPSLPSRFSGRAQCWSDPLGRLLSAGCLLTPCSPRTACIDADFKANQPSCFYVSGL